jgi:hypothetical protein
MNLYALPSCLTSKKDSKSRSSSEVFCEFADVQFHTNVLALYILAASQATSSIVNANQMLMLLSNISYYLRTAIVMLVMDVLPPFG